ncbi:MAG TPA: antitoxin [Dermatophilaceae bacterium]|nr:antitoxin [Dermatophilaceae bacterium]
MRTTLELDDQVLAAARSLARSRGTSLGAAVSELARRGLQAGAQSVIAVDVSYSPFPVLIGDPDIVVTDELVAELRDG